MKFQIQSPLNLIPGLSKSILLRTEIPSGLLEFENQFGFSALTLKRYSQIKRKQIKNSLMKTGRLI